jgi:hypothetical protein
MTCDAAIARANGFHGRCGLPRAHRGDCVPREAISNPTEWPEAQFVGHLLHVIESAGDTLTFVEALNLARALLRDRLGRRP